jgi:hypothetical protein
MLFSPSWLSSLLMMREDLDTDQVDFPSAWNEIHRYFLTREREWIDVLNWFLPLSIRFLFAESNVNDRKKREPYLQENRMSPKKINPHAWSPAPLMVD